MAPSHAATGAAAGVAATLATAPLTGMRADAWVLATGALIGAGAALLPDIDQPGSTAARSQGPVTGLAAAGAQALSAWAYRRTRTPNDARSTGTHRYLFHTPAFAVALGTVVGAAAMWRPAMAVIVWFTLSLALRGLGQALPKGRVRRGMTSWVAMTTTGRRLLRPLPRPLRRGLAEWLSVSLSAALITAVLIGQGAHTGPYIGLSLTLGMVVHSLGDALTRSAVPLAWPFQVHGRRWAMLGMPACLRFRTGSWPESVICIGSLTATGAGFLLAA
ncbi:metal-dependent hydrolase [Nocardiopsis sediminis]|uniref:Metal-dependent hydrolase n=1 Tax=Nocardiopsis sediminis TaxID=1778267 RepID=A0ABV8FE63_9ACTN